MLQNGSRDIDERLAFMRQRLEPIHASWEGAARAQFDALWQEWESAANQLRQSLDGISQLLATAAGAYEDAESQIRQSFTQ
jgi:WXG100 family type VII secretion target